MEVCDMKIKLMASRIEAAVLRLELNLQDRCVLTEAATGPYISTALIAALAGAKHVKACTRDSQWGSAATVKQKMTDLASHFGVVDRIEISEHSAQDMAAGADIVTNLGFVRPISRPLVERLPSHAVIALMWEPWEFRDEDIDLLACREAGIPIIGTNEDHPYVGTLRAVGLLALKLLMECDCEIFNLEITVIGSDPFGTACAKVLSTVGANVTILNPGLGWYGPTAENAFERADAVVVVEHRENIEILGRSTSPLVESLKKNCIPLVHICGNVDNDYLLTNSIKKYPPGQVKSGYMTVTTAHVGIKPVVDLHAAGLYAASVVVEERIKGASIEDAVNRAVASGLGRALDANQNNN